MHLSQQLALAALLNVLIRCPLHVTSTNFAEIPVLRLRGGGKAFVERSARLHAWRKQIAQAAGADDTRTLKTLLNAGIDVNTTDRDGWTLCHWAASRGCVSAISILNAHKVGINARDKHGSTPLHFAAAFGHRAAVKLLCSCNADLDAQDAVLNTLMRDRVHVT